MKLPQSFIPKKDLDREMERLLKEPDINHPKRLPQLLENCKFFLEEQKDLWYLNEIYNIAEDTVKYICYAQEDLEQLVKKVKINQKQDLRLGFYFSALINKIIKEGDLITLDLNEILLQGLGTSFEKGTLRIIGGTGYDTGFKMKGGLLIVNGNTGHNTGLHMVGGEIRVYEKIESIATGCEGTIYQNDKKVCPK